MTETNINIALPHFSSPLSSSEYPHTPLKVYIICYPESQRHSISFNRDRMAAVPQQQQQIDRTEEINNAFGAAARNIRSITRTCDLRAILRPEYQHLRVRKNHSMTTLYANI